MHVTCRPVEPDHLEVLCQAPDDGLPDKTSAARDEHERRRMAIGLFHILTPLLPSGSGLFLVATGSYGPFLDRPLDWCLHYVDQLVIPETFSRPLRNARLFME